MKPRPITAREWARAELSWLPFWAVLALVVSLLWLTLPPHSGGETHGSP